MVLSKELEAILELRRRKSEEHCADSNAVASVSGEVSDDDDLAQAAGVARTVGALTTPGAIDKELEYKLELLRQKSYEKSTNDDHLQSYNANIDCATVEEGHISNILFSDEPSPLGFTSEKKATGFSRPNTHSMRRLYHGVDKDSARAIGTCVGLDRKQTQPSNPPTTAPSTFPFPRSSPRASSPPNPHDLAALTSNSYSSIKTSTGTASSAKPAPTLSHTSSLKHRILQASLTEQQDCTAEFITVKTSPPSCASITHSKHMMEDDEQDDADHNIPRHHQYSNDLKTWNHESHPYDRQEESFPNKYFNTSSSEMKDHKDPEIIEALWGENSESPHLESQSANTDFFSSVQFDNTFSAFLQHQQQNDTAEGARNLQQEKDFFSSSSFDDDGSKLINSGVNNELFSPRHAEIEEVQWPANHTDLNEYQEELFSKTVDEDEEEEITYQDTAEEKQTISSDIQHQNHHPPIQRKVFLQSAQLPYEGEFAAKPVINSMTGNFIICRVSAAQKCFFLEEVDPIQGRVILSTSILSKEFQRKASSFLSMNSPSKVVSLAISSIKSIASGIHCSRNGRARVKVSAIIDLTILTGTNSTDTATVVVVWKWRYGSEKPIALQSVLWPPQNSTIVGGTSHSFLSYNPEIFCSADGLLFLGGSCRGTTNKPNASLAVACVYIAKPHIRGSWSCSIVGRETSLVSKQQQHSPTITALGVTCHPKRPFKYLAVATNLGCLSIWTYESAVATNRVDDKYVTSQQKQLLEQLYILQGAEVLLPCEETLFDTFEIDEMDVSILESNYCTHLEWYPPMSASSNNPLCMLAASFLNGLLVYHVLPPDRRNSSESEISATTIPPIDDYTFRKRRQESKIGYTTENSEQDNPQKMDYIEVLSPMTVTKASLAALRRNADNKQVEPVRTMVVWLNLGPRFPPTLALLFESIDVAGSSIFCRLVLGFLSLPVFGTIDTTGASQKAPYVALSQDSFSTPVTDSPMIAALIGSTANSFIPFFLVGKIFLFLPSLRTITKGQIPTNHSECDERVLLPKRGCCVPDPYFSAQFRPLSSHTLGGLDSRGIILQKHPSNLWIFTQLFCCRRRSESDSRISSSEFYWEPPMQRHWLCCSTYIRKRGVLHENPTGGSSTSIICELTCSGASSSGLIPSRLCVDSYNSFAVVLYCLMKSGIETHINPDPFAFAIVPLAGKKYLGPLELRFGRDVAFPEKIDCNENNTSKIIVLGKDGYSLYVLTKNTDSIKGSILWREGCFTKVELRDYRTSEAYVEARRIFIVPVSNKLAFMGTSNRDGLSCLIVGRGTLDSCLSGQLLDQMLPCKDSSILWLQKGEEVVSLVSLPPDSTLKPFLAVSTQLRVLIVDHSLLIISQVLTSVTCDALIPLGSRCVCFCSSVNFHLPSSKIRYLSCLDEPHKTGIISTLEGQNRVGSSSLFLSMFPDRLHYVETISRDCVWESSDQDAFLVPIALTKPALLLQPLVANALCLCDDPMLCAVDNDVVQSTLRSVIDSFGRRLSNLPHGETQGIGVQGTGVTSKVYQMLSHYHCVDASSLILTMKNSQGAVYPRWIPTWIKAKNSSNIDELKQVLMHGNRYLSEYVYDPRNAMPVSLVDSYDPSSLMCHLLGIDAIINGEGSDALALLDLAGNEQSEQLITSFGLLSKLFSSNAANPLLLLVGDSLMKTTESTECKSACSAIAATFLELNERQSKGKTAAYEHGVFHKTSDLTSRLWTYHLAPLVQDSRCSRRIRNSLLSDHDNPLIQSTKRLQRKIWSLTLLDTKSVWFNGPSGNKEELLMLDAIEDWLGRCRPAILGREGAAAAKESGITVLSGILAAAAASEENDQDIDTALTDGWTLGVGEGRSDEENLAAYYRFSEGGDEDQRWIMEGIQDLSPYKHRGMLLGTDVVALEATTASVDEGEEGKVSVLYDLVYTLNSNPDSIVGLVVEAKRGSSLDVGILHSQEHESRQRCSIEFWFNCPNKDLLRNDIILVRRSIVTGSARLAHCCAAVTDGLLWELALLPSGQLQFRTHSDSLLSSTETDRSKKTSEESSHGSGDSVNVGGEPTTSSGLVAFQRRDGSGGWNHVCLVLSCRGLPSIADVSVRIVMKGTTVSRTVAKISSPCIPSLEDINESLKETALFFGLGGTTGFRMTEIRVWSCERNDNDIKASMYEYLSAAENKPKFKVKIRNLDQNVRRPRSAIRIAAIAPRAARPTVTFPSIETMPKKVLIPLDVIGKDEHKIDDISREKRRLSHDESYTAVINDNSGLRQAMHSLAAGITDENTSETGTARDSPLSYVGKSSDVSPGRKQVEKLSPLLDYTTGPIPNSIVEEYRIQAKNSQETIEDTKKDGDSDDGSYQSLFLDEFNLLSQEMRKSIAAALIRGPPAARHFGGNRGAVHSVKKCGIPSISICGTDKTVIYTFGQKTPLKTYAISASGAITSEAVNSSTSQYLCCFLAKEKKLIVYDLKNKIMLVELTMTTKLNFWSSLPEEAHGNTVVFLLITPLGGFHWLPLDVDPSPRLIWKRSPELQSKRILTYEEGGSNGLDGTLSRSTVALTLVCSSTYHSLDLGTNLEAWCIPLQSNAPPTSFGHNVISAAFCKPPLFGRKGRAFLPWVCVLCQESDESGDRNRIVLKVESLSQGFGNEPHFKRLVVAHREVYVEESEFNAKLPEPSLSIGLGPDAFIFSYEDAVIVLFRKQGLVYAYALESGELTLIGRKNVGHFIVDATLAAGELKGEIEIIMLLCSPLNTRDGRISVCQVSRYGCVL